MLKRTDKEEMQQIINLLKQKPEIDQKVEYYKSVLFSTEELIKSIDETIERGYNAENILLIGFIPISKRVPLTRYDKAKLEIEKFEADDKIYQQQQYYEMWLKRSKEYEVKFDEITRDCNENFEEVLKLARGIKSKNPRLAMSMDKYENPDNDQRLKNEYFLYLKQEVKNYNIHGKGRAKKFT